MPYVFDLTRNVYTDCLQFDQMLADKASLPSECSTNTICPRNSGRSGSRFGTRSTDRCWSKWRLIYAQTYPSSWETSLPTTPPFVQTAISTSLTFMLSCVFAPGFWDHTQPATDCIQNFFDCHGTERVMRCIGWIMAFIPRVLNLTLARFISFICFVLCKAFCSTGVDKCCIFITIIIIIVLWWISY